MRTSFLFSGQHWIPNDFRMIIARRLAENFGHCVEGIGTRATQPWRRLLWSGNGDSMVIL